MKPIKIYCELYGRNILAFPSWKKEDFEKYINKYFVSGFEVGVGYDGLHVCLIKGGENLNIIWCRDRLNKQRQLIVLAHEALHCAVNILNDAGVPIEAKNDESLCYYQGFLLKRIL